MNHGTRSSYVHNKCRCPECTKANRNWCRTRRQARAVSGPPPDKHGRYTTYVNWGCRCPECKAAWSIWLRNKRYPVPEGGT